mgnify:CR=1 FL=1
MIEIIIAVGLTIVFGLLLFSKKGGAIEENPVVWFDKRGYEVVKWGYAHGLGDSEPSVLWVKARAIATKKKEKQIYMEFDRNEDFEINYQHLQY